MSWSELYPEQFPDEAKFKEQVSLDNKATFLELAEFAERHEINGVEYTCIVQQIASKEDLTIDKNNDYFPYLYGNGKTINIAKDDLPEAPVYGQRLVLDYEIYSVMSCADDMGILTIVILGDDR